MAWRLGFFVKRFLQHINKYASDSNLPIENKNKCIQKCQTQCTSTLNDCIFLGQCGYILLEVALVPLLICWMDKRWHSVVHETHHQMHKNQRCLFELCAADHLAVLLKKKKRLHCKSKSQLTSLNQSFTSRPLNSGKQVKNYATTIKFKSFSFHKSPT